jgi:hypothetical protein
VQYAIVKNPDNPQVKRRSAIPPNVWTAVRGPLLVAMVLGCCISLMDAGTLTLRLALPSAFWWTYVPLLEVVSLFAASRTARQAGPWAETIDCFFRGHYPWLLWLIALSAYFALNPTAEAFSWPARNRVWYYSADAVIVWSAYVDFQFFRKTLGMNAWRAGRDLAVQRAIAWGCGLAIFVGPAAYQMMSTWLGI